MAHRLGSANPVGDDAGEISHPEVRRMTTFRQATLSRLRLDPASLRHSGSRKKLFTSDWFWQETDFYLNNWLSK